MTDPRVVREQKLQMELKHQKDLFRQVNEVDLHEAVDTMDIDKIKYVLDLAQQTVDSVHRIALNEEKFTQEKESKCKM